MDNERLGSEGPRISGFSTPVGSSTKKKQESPAQRSEKINGQNAQAPQQPQTINPSTPVIERKAVSQDEIDDYRKRRNQKRKTIAITAVVLILLGTGAGFFIFNKIKKSKYNANASYYNNEIPIVVNTGDKSFLINQNGSKISGEYDFISNYEGKTTLAINRNEGKLYYSILDTNGKEIAESGQLIEKVENGKNYILHEDDKAYIADENGKKLSELAITNPNLHNYDYALVNDETKIAIIDNTGKEKFSRVIDGFEVTNFAYAKNEYEDTYYCEIGYKNKTDSEVVVYNCETAKEVKRISDTSAYADFYDEKTPLLQVAGKYYYFYDNDMLYESEKPSEVLFGGIIKTEDEEGQTKYYDPKDKKLQDEYPIHTLISQKKFDTTTEITETCDTYEKLEKLKLVKVCDNIYQNDKLLKLDYENYFYDFLPEELSNYLNYLGKNYILRTNKNTRIQSIYNIDAKTTVKDLNDISVNFNLENSSFVTLRNTGGKRKIYNLITDKTIEIESQNSPEYGANSISVVFDGETHYYNKDGKEIYKITKGEQ